jgi:hypothetical protein
LELTDTTHDRKLKIKKLYKAGTKRKHSTEEWLEMNDKTPKLQKKINENKKHKRKKIDIKPSKLTG